LTPAMIGAASAGMTTLDRNTPKSTELSPAPTMAAPMRPPKSAWDDEDGRPKRQVAMVQMIAPMSAERMKAGVIWTPTVPCLMIPPEMVLAISVERKAPPRLRIAARVTAVLGLIAPVAIGVAMALAVS